MATRYKDFSQSNIISIDCETYDPDLETKGPSVKTGGFVIGIGLADETGFREYYPLDHKDTTDEEFEKNNSFLKGVMANNVPKLGMNLLYDLDWIVNYLEMEVNGQLSDIMVAEALINENQLHYSLNYMAMKYLQESKSEDEIKEYCDRRGWKGAPQKHLYKMPSGLVGKYCIEDTRLTLDIFRIQKILLSDEDLTDVFNLEMRLFPVLIHMRNLGVRVNSDRAFELEDNVKALLKSKVQQLNTLAGFELNYNSSDQIGKVCDRHGIEYPRTEKTKKPSFTKEWLAANSDRDPLFNLILSCRKYNKALGTFIESQILNQIVDSDGSERIFPQFHPSKGGVGGTVTGRFSASNPNLQFIPNPKSEMNEGEDINFGRALRGIFIPEEGEVWGKIDYSQIEIRLLAHYAVGSKSEEIKEKFISQRDVDYHQWCADLAKIDRHRAKKINFSIIYGMGANGIAAKLGLGPEEGKEFYDDYLYNLPFIKKTLLKAKSVAESRGYVKTIMGRRRRFPERNFAYKALNAVIQGSAADLMKKGMVDAWEAGVFGVIKPLITVHDELDNSVPRNKIGLEAFRELHALMEKAIEISVPVYADCEVGLNWGDVSEDGYEDFIKSIE